jgi:fibronectin-binding autotransporter adhesin
MAGTALALGLAGTLFGAAQASAAVINFNGDVSSDFANGANWVGGVAPGATDTAVIPAGEVAVVSTGPLSVAALQVNGTGTLGITGMGAQLSVTGASADPSVLGGTGGEGVTVGAGGTLTIGSGKTVTGTKVVVDGGTLTVNGTARLGHIPGDPFGISLLLRGAATVDGSGLLDIVPTNEVGSAIQKEDAGTAVVKTNTVNTWAVNAAGGTLDLEQWDDYFIAGNGPGQGVRGAVNVEDAAILQLPGSTNRILSNASVWIVGDGAIQNQASAPVTFTNLAGRLVLEGGTRSYGSPNLLGGSMVLLNGNYTVPGPITVPSGSDLNVSGGLAAFTGGGITVDGMLGIGNTANVTIGGPLTVRDGGLISGQAFLRSPARIDAASVNIQSGGRAVGSIEFADGVVVDGEYAPQGFQPTPGQPAGGLVGGNLALNGAYEVSLFQPPAGNPLNTGIYRATATGAAAIGGILRVNLMPLDLTNPNSPLFDPPVGQTYTALSGASASGQFTAVQGAVLRNLAGNPTGKAVVLDYPANQARLTVAAAALPELGAQTVTPGVNAVDVSVPVDANNVATTVRLRYGLTGLTTTVNLGPANVAGTTPTPVAVAISNLAAGTYQYELVAISEFGSSVAKTGSFTVTGATGGTTTPGGTPVTPGGTAVTPGGGTTTPGTTPPGGTNTPQELPALAPVGATVPRALAASRLKAGKLRVTIPYRLTRSCATPCKARVELRLRRGKQLFDVALAGDGKVLASKRNVVLSIGSKPNLIKLDIAKAVASKIVWARSGKFRTANIRLRVILPQADGRELVTVRDGTLRAPLPKPRAR